MALAIWLLFLVPLGLALATQGLLKWVFRRYRAVSNRAGVGGAEVTTPVEPVRSRAGEG